MLSRGPRNEIIAVDGDYTSLKMNSRRRALIKFKLPREISRYYFVTQRGAFCLYTRTHTDKKYYLHHYAATAGAGAGGTLTK